MKTCSAFEQAVQKVIKNYARDTHYGTRCIHCERPATLDYNNGEWTCFHDVECPIEILNKHFPKEQP